MKKILTITSLIISIIILLSSLFILTQFNLEGYTTLEDNDVTQIQTLINNNPEYFSEVDQRFLKLNVDMKEVSEEFDKRDKIISKSEGICGLITLGISILFIINIYNLVIAFRNEEK
jgi:hypothetical protein